MQWHWWQTGQTTPTIYEDEVLLRQDVAQAIAAGHGPIVIHCYQHALQRTEVYGVPGGNPVPTLPDPLIPTDTVNIPHVRKRS